MRGSNHSRSAMTVTSLSAPSRSKTCRSRRSPALARPLFHTASLMKNLTKLAGSVEYVYVLTSAWTFSAGIVSVALLKEHNGRKVTLIGEPVGDRIRLWAEGVA